MFYFLRFNNKKGNRLCSPLIEEIWDDTHIYMKKHPEDTRSEIDIFKSFLEKHTKKKTMSI